MSCGAHHNSDPPSGNAVRVAPTAHGGIVTRNLAPWPRQPWARIPEGGVLSAHPFPRASKAFCLSSAFSPSGSHGKTAIKDLNQCRGHYSCRHTKIGACWPAGTYRDIPGIYSLPFPCTRCICPAARAPNTRARLS